jgi:hypothetical protein
MTGTELIPGAVRGGNYELTSDRPVQTAGTGAALFSADAQIQAQVCGLLPSVAGNK